MKKLIPLVILLVVFLGGCYFTYNYYYGGSSYYTQITTEGKKTTEKNDSGQVLTAYDYQQPAYDAQGKKITVKLHEVRDKPLKLRAYLKLKVNPHKGVLSWEEVQQEDIPEKAIAEME